MTSHTRRANTRAGLDPRAPRACPTISTRRRSPAAARCSTTGAASCVGLPYGQYDPDAADAGEHGVLMLIICADLFRQYEFVQQQWINYGLDARAGSDTCPSSAIIRRRGYADEEARRRNGPKAKFVAPADPASGCPPFIAEGLPQFVETRGGEYFFAPVSAPSARSPEARSIHLISRKERPMNPQALVEKVKGAVTGFFRTIAASVEARFLLWRAAATALWSLLRGAIALLRGEQPFKARVAAFLAKASVQKDIFALLRAVKPNLSLPKKITSVDNAGTVLVTRAADVIEVLDREADFGVIYGAKMIKLTGGANFYLGMQAGDDYQRDVSFMRLTMRREDAQTLIAPLARAKAREILDAHPKSIDLPADLTLAVPTFIVAEYFGVPAPRRKR